MNNDESRIDLKNNARCVICGEPVLAPPFVASKQRRGSATIYAHTKCLEQEQQGGGET